MKATSMILLAAALALPVSASAQTREGEQALATQSQSATPQSATPAGAPAQSAGTAGGSPPSSGEIIVGARVNSTPAMGRYMRYDDQRSGAILERLNYRRDRGTWVFTANVFDAGYRDQHYFAGFEQVGKLRASFDFNQTPLWFGDVEQTPYREEAPGVYRLNDTVQAAIQNGTATIAAYGSELQNLDMRLRRDTASGRFSYSATRNLDLSVAFNSMKRSGHQPWAASFGFSNADVVPLAIDRRTNDMTAALEWSNQRGMVRVAYDGSWFNNNVSELVWDNPLRSTDTTTASAYSTGAASSQGRMSLPPDSTAHTVSGTGSIKLPARGRLFAYVSVGTWLQNDRLLPFTINTAIAPIALPRETAEAKALITSTNFRYTSRPTANTWFSANYRLYDFDNQSEPFPLTNIVRLDGTLAASPESETQPFGYKRQFGDLDASYTRFRYVALRGGYGVEHDNRTHRYVESTTDHQVRASIDSSGLAWGSVRLQYDRSIRTGSGLDEQVLEDLGEQQSLRQFDIANRTRDRVSAIVQYLPVESLTFNVTGSLGREHRPDSTFGLQDNNIHAATLGVDYTVGTFMTVGLNYSFENYGTLQRSRQANPPPDPTFYDARRDWQTDMNEDVNTIGFNIEIPSLVRNTSFRLAFDDVHDHARYLYELAQNSTLNPVQQLPHVKNHFSQTSADLRYSLSNQASVGAGYRIDYFDTNDFALTPGIMNTPLIPTFINLMYQWRPYTVQTGFVRFIYTF